MTLYGQAALQFLQPLATSCWMKTVSNSVRMSGPGGPTSMQPGVEGEWEGGQLVDDWDGGWIGHEVDAEQIAAACFASFDTHVGKNGLARGHALVAKPAFQTAHDAPALTGRGPFFAEDRESRARVFAAAGARHARVPPAAVAARAEEKASAGREVFARQREVSERRWSSTAGAVEMVADSTAR